MVSLCVRWKKLVKSTKRLDPKDAEGAQDTEGNTSINYTMVEMQFNSLTTEIFESSDMEE